MGPQGLQAYNQSLQASRSIPFLPLFIAIFYLLPLTYHSLYGLILFSKTKQGPFTYAQVGSSLLWIYQLTGFLSFFFLLYHFKLTQLDTWILGVKPDYDWMVKLFEVPFRVWIYILGIPLVFFHFWYGVWLFLNLWGITLSQRSQRMSRRLCLIFFCLSTVMALLCLAHFATHFGGAPWGVGPLLDFVRDYLFLQP